MVDNAVVVDSWDLFIYFCAAPVMAKTWDVYFKSTLPLPAPTASTHAVLLKVSVYIVLFTLQK